MTSLKILVVIIITAIVAILTNVVASYVQESKTGKRKGLIISLFIFLSLITGFIVNNPEGLNEIWNFKKNKIPQNNDLFPIKSKDYQNSHKQKKQSRELKFNEKFFNLTYKDSTLVIYNVTDEIFQFHFKSKINKNKIGYSTVLYPNEIQSIGLHNWYSQKDKSVVGIVRSDNKNVGLTFGDTLHYIFNFKYKYILSIENEKYIIKEYSY